MSLRGKSFLPAQDLQLQCALDYGEFAVLTDAWQRYGLQSLFAGLGTKRQQSLLQAMIFARLLFPCAKLALAEQSEGTALAQSCGLSAEESFDEDDLYEAMDLLNGQWVALEKRLYQEAFPKGVRFLLYDLSSVYFEGKGPFELSRYGHSSDHRSDRPQILLAVAPDTEGVPLHVEVLRGNRAGNKTLQGLLATLQRRFGLTEVAFVFDGGMSSVVNLNALSKAGMQFVTRLSNATLEALLSDRPAEEQLELGDCSQVVELLREVIERETQRDGWYLLHTNCPAPSCPKEQVLAHYKGLLDVEEAFCELKSFLEVRPVFHRRPHRASRFRSKTFKKIEKLHVKT